MKIQKQHVRKYRKGGKVRLINRGVKKKRVSNKSRKKRSFRSIDLFLAEDTQADVRDVVRKLSSPKIRNQPAEWMEEHDRAKRMANAYLRDIDERGYHQPTVNTIKKLANAMGEDYLDLRNEYDKKRTFGSRPMTISELDKKWKESGRAIKARSGKLRGFN